MIFQDCKVPELVFQDRIWFFKIGFGFSPKDFLRIGSGFYGFSSDRFFTDFLKKKLIDIGLLFPVFDFVQDQGGFLRIRISGFRILDYGLIECINQLQEQMYHAFQ